MPFPLLSREGTRRFAGLGNLAYVAALLALVPLIVYYLDGSVRTFILSVQREWGTTVAIWVSRTGHGLLGGAVCASLVAVGLLMGRPREAVAGLLGLFAMIGGGLSVEALKYLFCRSRPLAEGAGQFFAVFPCIGKGYALKSFPSGHSVTGFALAYVLSRAYPKASPLFYALATMIALSRVYLATHFLSDVVAGAAVGLLAGWAVCRLAHFPVGDAPR